jgi:hypothetical protein
VEVILDDFFPITMNCGLPPVPGGLRRAPLTVRPPAEMINLI